MLILSLFHRQRAFLLTLFFFSCSLAHAATKWQDPTPEELSMTSQPQVPGAAAVILYREETVDDEAGSWTYYYRIKILTQTGRDRYSNVSIAYPVQSSNLYYNITNIAGRTIHSDGSILPFTGKPFQRIVEHSSSQSTRETVITLPAVQIGSIIEYRYSMHLDHGVRFDYGSYVSFTPTFYAQGDLFTRSEHFLWHTRQRADFTSSLPGGASAVKVKDYKNDWHDVDYTVELQDVLPVADEPFMPPASTLEQKVVFYTGLPTSIHRAEDYWKQTGEEWSKDINSFIGPPSKLADAAAAITAGATTPEAKLRKLYAAVQQMENTDFSRDRSDREKKAAGISIAKSARDVFEQKRGDDFELTYLMVGLARAAGFNAYVMAVTNRDVSRFTPQYLTFRQLNDDLAIVELNNQDLFLDPAEPLCPFGQLLWPHSNAAGLRQVSSGVAFAVSPSLKLKDSETRRVANLVLDASGHQSGAVDMAFFGAPALRWRQSSLLGDEAGMHQDLEKYLLTLVPNGTDVALTSVENLHDEDKPLIAHFKVSGPLANFTGHRAFIPAQFFEVNNTPLFPAATRTQPVEFSYPESFHDAVSVKFPASWEFDSAPPEESDLIPKMIACEFHIQILPTAIILRRDFIFGGLSVEPARYTDLRNFYEKVVTRDHASVLFQARPNSTTAPLTSTP